MVSPIVMPSTPATASMSPARALLPRHARDAGAKIVPLLKSATPTVASASACVARSIASCTYWSNSRAGLSKLDQISAARAPPVSGRYCASIVMCFWALREVGPKTLNGEAEGSHGDVLQLQQCRCGIRALGEGVRTAESGRDFRVPTISWRESRCFGGDD